MHIKYFGFTFACLMLQSSTILASITVPYIKPMLLGRTFDYSMSKVGNDIFPASVRNNPEIRDHHKFYIKYRMIRDAKDVRDILDVSGQLSLQVMAGLVDIKGKGSYVRESSKSGNFVEVLARIYYETVTKTITDEMKPTPDWNKRSIVGKHYVRSITYGGYLIASLKFHAKNRKNKENIEASVEADLRNPKYQVGVEGQFKQLASSVKDISTLTISLTATTRLTTVPTDIDSLLKVIKDFPDTLKTINGGIGVPIEAEIVELKLLSDNPKFNFRIDGLTKIRLADVELYYYDLRTTSDALSNFLKRSPHLSKDGETKIGVFYNKIVSITEIFNSVIASIDLNTYDEKTAKQFNKAFDAYKDGEITFLPDKFLRKFNALIATITQKKENVKNRFENLKVGDRVIGRWALALYSPGKVKHVSSTKYTISFDDGDEKTHNIGDKSAVIVDKCPQVIKAGQHVVGRWKGSSKYYIGFVKEITSSGKFAVRLDNNKEDLYNKCDLRIFPDHTNPYELGARVFGRWYNGLYYRGFVIQTTGTKVYVICDGGNTIWLNKNDKNSVILDKLEKTNSIHPNQRVIGYWPKRRGYYPGKVTSKGSRYFVRYDNKKGRYNQIYEIRAMS